MLFRLTYDGPWMINDAAKDNPYQYNGKELNLDHGLNWSDYGARWYDACVGRWSCVDPMAEVNPDWNPYRYGFNNPLTYTDPTGMIEGHGLGGRNLGKQAAADNVNRVMGIDQESDNSNESNSSSNEQSNNNTNCDCDCPGKPPCGNKSASIGESFVPFYGSYLDMAYRWERGEYIRSFGNLVLLITDAALVKSLFGGFVKSGFKGASKGFAKSGISGIASGTLRGSRNYFGIGMSHSWGATTARWGNLGLGGGVKHHWLISQSMMESYTWLKPLGNQAWNITTFSSRASHMRWAHGTRYLNQPAINGSRLLYPISSTPT